eukprot:12267-Heterococcus_DN1.PRE.1
MPLLRTIAEKLKASGGTLKYSAKLQSCALHAFAAAVSLPASTSPLTHLIPSCMYMYMCTNFR